MVTVLFCQWCDCHEQNKGIYLYFSLNLVSNTKIATYQLLPDQAHLLITNNRRQCQLSAMLSQSIFIRRGLSNAHPHKGRARCDHPNHVPRAVLQKLLQKNIPQEFSPRFVGYLHSSCSYLFRWREECFQPIWYTTWGSGLKITQGILNLTWEPLYFRDKLEPLKNKKMPKEEFALKCRSCTIKSHVI